MRSTKTPGVSERLLKSPQLHWPRVVVVGDAIYLTSQGSQDRGIDGAVYRLDKP